MKIFLTGATGYIGNKIALAAATRQYEVCALAREPSSPNVPRHPNIKTVKGDITDRRSVTTAIKDSDFVIHTAGLTRLWCRDPERFYTVHVEGTRNLLEAAAEHGIRKFVYTSSCALLGPSSRHPLTENDPRITSLENDYEISKQWAEELVREHNTRGLPAVIVAPSRVYGPGIQTSGNPVTRHISRLLNRRIAFVPARTGVRGNYAFIDDVVEGHLLALERGKAGEKYILGGENISYAEFFFTLRQLAGKKIMLLKVPGSIMKAWGHIHAAVFRLRNKDTHINAKTIARLLENREVNCAKAIHELGYAVTPFTQGMRLTLESLRQI